MVTKLSSVPRLASQVVRSAKAIIALRRTQQALDVYQAREAFRKPNYEIVARALGTTAHAIEVSVARAHQRPDARHLAKVLGTSVEAADDLVCGFVSQHLPAKDLARLSSTLRIASWLAPFIPGGDRAQLRRLGRDVTRAQIAAVDELVGVQNGLRRTLSGELSKAKRSQQLARPYIARHWHDTARTTLRQLGEVTDELDVLSLSLGGRLI